MAINITDFDKIWASSSPLTPYSFSDANYRQGWNFVGATPPARQMWDAYMKWSDEKQQYIVNNFLPLSGGTITGTLIVGTNTKSRGLMAQNGTSCFRIASGEYTYADSGAFIHLFSKTADTDAGKFQISAHGSTEQAFIGKPDGTLTWNGQPIQVSSDKRLKTDFADVPADVLEAWEQVEWRQFKYIADKEKKGDSCRWHTGLVAQDVQDACGDKILQYGILCKEDDMWMVRYTEALCMEVAFLRKKLKAIEEKLAKLEK